MFVSLGMPLWITSFHIQSEPLSSYLLLACVIRLIQSSHTCATILTTGHPRLPERERRIMIDTEIHFQQPSQQLDVSEVCQVRRARRNPSMGCSKERNRIHLLVLQHCLFIDNNPMKAKQVQWSCLLFSLTSVSFFPLLIICCSYLFARKSCVVISTSRKQPFFGNL